MFSLDEARALVQQHLDSISSDPGDIPLALFEGAGEYAFGWAFHYNSREYVEKGDPRWRLVGHGPLLFDTSTGEIIPTGSGQPESVSVDNYLRHGKPYVELGSGVTLASSRPGADRHAAIRAIQAATHGGLQAAKLSVDLCMAGAPATVECGSVAAAHDLVGRLGDLGFSARQEPRSTSGADDLPPVPDDAAASPPSTRT